MSKKSFSISIIGISTWLIILSLMLVGCGVDKPIESSRQSDDVEAIDSAQNQLVSYPVSQLNPYPHQSATATPIAPEVLAEAQAVELVFINIYERVNPAVVNIEVVDSNSSSESFTSSGSGFVYDMAGHVITNAHVVLDAREIVVTFYDGSIADAEIVGVDNFSDLAVIRVNADASHLVPVTFGDSNAVKVGQQIVAIGNPFGLQSSMTIGSVSATGRALPSEQLVNLERGGEGYYNNPSIIQVDASINPGNSGGPVLNLNGEVIGVAAAIRTETGIFQGVAFAIPSNTVVRIIPQLIANGKVVYPYLGISAPQSDRGVTVAALADEYNLPVRTGVLVAEVREDSPAANAGIRGGTEEIIFREQRVQMGGDIIVAVNGQFVNDLDELLAYLIQNTYPGDTITLTIVRGGDTLEVPVVVGERPR